jgi:hypothetical protein
MGTMSGPIVAEPPTDDVPFHPDLLAVVFLLVMGAAVACFLRAFALRRDTPRHVRWAVAGVVIDVVGTIVVLVTQRLLDWDVEPRFPGVAQVHRAFAYAATVLVVLQAWSGATRRPWHRYGWPVFLPVYVGAYLLAVWAYAPF